MIKKLLLTLTILSTAFGTISAGAAETVIRVGGSGTGTGVMKHLAAEFEKINPGIKISIAPSLGSSGGIKALLGGSLDIAMSARQLSDAEKGSGALPVFSGRSPFVFMVNKKVTRSGISTKELEAYYGMRQTTWGDGSPVRLILRPEGDSDTKLIQAMSPELTQSLKNAISRHEMYVALTDQDSDKAIVSTPGALGATTLAQFLSDKLDGKLLAFNGVKPSLKTVKDGSYPLIKAQMVIMIPAKATPAVKKFISYITSPKAAGLWEKYGILPDGKSR